jgi:hypothetical protein
MVNNSETGRITQSGSGETTMVRTFSRFYDDPAGAPWSMASLQCQSLSLPLAARNPHDYDNDV